MTELKKNMIIPVEIEGYTSEGYGVAKPNGHVVFIKGALQGEICQIKILKAGKNVSYGKIESIIHPSPHRVEPSCPSFGKCGGCSLLHMDYNEELGYKKQVVENALLRIGKTDIPVSAIHGSPDTEFYRNKVIYNIQRDKSGKIIYGFYRQRSHDVVPGKDCVIGFREADCICQTVTSWMEKFRIPAYDPITRTGLIRHVFVRRGMNTKEIQVGIVSKEQNIPEIDYLMQSICSSCDNVKSIILNVNKSTGNTVLAGEFYTVFGNDYISDILCGLKFDLSLRSFFQINPKQAENLYNKAIEYADLTGKETVLDLYCGTGTITLCLAKQAKNVIGAEIVPEAIENAKENAVKNSITNAEFYCADASQIAANLLADGLKPDVITVDPPRKGLSADVIKSVSEMSPERVVYISCDPGTLSRDINIFSSFGYQPVKAECFDMFPRCSHVETVVWMSRQNL